MRKLYLGDGAYAEEGSYPGEIVLTTSNGIQETNRIVLGPDEVQLLEEFIEAVYGKVHGEKS